MLLYAQVTQADGVDHRNVLLSRKPGPIQEKRFRGQSSVSAMGVPGYGYWDEDEVEALLSALGLPLDSPLSVLAVEVLPEIGRRGDPLGSNLGYVRILRTSPLAAVPSIC
jgi:hypothetical protein